MKLTYFAFSIVAAALAACTAVPPLPAFRVCPQQVDDGVNADNQPVIICKKLFPEAPFVHLPEDIPASNTMYGIVELDMADDGEGGHQIDEARFIDRDLKVHRLLYTDGKLLHESLDLMKKNYLPSNRVHFQIYEVRGKVGPLRAGDKEIPLFLEDLRPIVMIEGQAIDERFLGPWEGRMSKRARGPDGKDIWLTDPSKPDNFVKVRVEFSAPLVPYINIGAYSAQNEPFLSDGTRFKAIGNIANAKTGVRLSSGECVPSLTSYGQANPIPVDDYSLKMWRFPAMHSQWTKDFHIVFNYPNGLYPATLAMASEHNFFLKNFIAPSTKPEELAFLLHGNPINQLSVYLKPVRGGGESCTP